jgi:polyisoprenoid-binding protein YceI
MTIHHNPILRTLALPCLVVWLAVAPAAVAQQKASALDFNLDPANTVIHWTLNTNVHVVHGTFKLKNGNVHIDPATGNATGLIVIDATSGDSGDSTRDKRMNSVVLETSRFPDVTFRPTHVQGKVDLNAPGPITLAGVLNLHGQDHPIELAVDLHPKDAGLASQTHFTIPFVAWGMKDPSVLLFRTDKQVAIDIEATAVHSVDSARLR